MFLGMVVSEVRAQSIKRLGTAASYGAIIAHSSDLVPISQTNPRGLSAAFQIMNPNKESWETCNCFYYLGLNFSYHNFDNPILGSAFSLSGTFEPTLWRRGQWTFSLNSGIGISYLNRVFDSQTNPENKFFSVPVSFLLSIAPTMEYRFSPEWSGQFFLTYNHISNGGRRQPNKGMNYPMGGIGLNHYLSHHDLPRHSGTVFSRNWEYYAEAGYTSKNAEWASDRKPALSLTVGFSRPISTLNALGGGLELGRDYSIPAERSKWNMLTPAPFIAHHFMFGRIDFSQRFAFYTFKPSFYDDRRFYQRYVLQYRMWDHIKVGVGLKSHGHVAENIDIRIGWKF